MSWQIYEKNNSKNNSKNNILKIRILGFYLWKITIMES